MQCCEYLVDYRKSSPRRQLKRPQLFPGESTKGGHQAGAGSVRIPVVPVGVTSCLPRGTENVFLGGPFHCVCAGHPRPPALAVNNSDGRT